MQQVGGQLDGEQITCAVSCSLGPVGVQQDPKGTGIRSITVCNVLCVYFVYMYKISLCARMCQGINQALTVLKLELSLGTNQLIFFPSWLSSTFLWCSALKDRMF